MKYKLFDEGTLNNLRLEAHSSARKRAHYNIHSSYSEAVQKVLICLLHDTYIPPHYHKYEHQSELFIVLRGHIKLIFFDENGNPLKTLPIGDNCDAFMIEMQSGTIHTVICESKEAFILEIKQGPFIANDCKVFPEWVILENDLEAKSYLEKLGTFVL